MAQMVILIIVINSCPLIEVVPIPQMMQGYCFLFQKMTCKIFFFCSGVSYINVFPWIYQESLLMDIGIQVPITEIFLLLLHCLDFEREKSVYLGGMTRSNGYWTRSAGKRSSYKHKKAFGKLMNSDDRISNLLNSILCSILSFLPWKKVVATSILSGWWKFLWTESP